MHLSLLQHQYQALHGTLFRTCCPKFGLELFVLSQVVHSSVPVDRRE